MPCAYCDADVDGGCKGSATATDCLLDQLRTARANEREWHLEYKQARRDKNAAVAEMTKLRKAIGDPFMTGHSGCEGGPFVRLHYETVEEAMHAQDALMALLRLKPSGRR